jgi:hypothetical protein
MLRPAIDCRSVSAGVSANGLSFVGTAASILPTAEHLQRIFLAVEAMNFKVTIIGHHVLKAQVCKPVEELQKFVQRELNADSEN